MIIILLLHLCVCHAGVVYGNPARALAGKIASIDVSGKRIVINTDEGVRKQILISPQTKFFKKTRPLPADFNATIRDFRAGDRIIVVSGDISPATITAGEIWGDRAFAVQKGLVQTEKSFAGEVLQYNPSGIVTLRTFRGEVVKAKIVENTKIIFDNEEGQLSDVHPGSKVALYCRWKGFIEDMPSIPDVSEFMDSKTYVIRKYSETFGALLTRGRVTNVSIPGRSIKVATPDGIVANIGFSRLTRWIPATPKIKSPGDFNGYEVYIFGKPAEQAVPVADMVMNTMGVNSIFQSLQVSGTGIKGAVTVLAFGKVLYIDQSRIIVETKERNVRIRLLNKTIFLKKEARCQWNNIQKGEWVSVKGIYDDPPVALVVRSFGNIRQ
jgi:hypothetical protein